MSDLTFTKVADLPVAHIQNFYSSDELKKIMNELEYLYSIDRYKGAEEDGGPGTAYEDGVALKVGKGLHLNVVYDDPKQSDILGINRKIFNESLMETLMSNHPFFRYLWRSNRDETKIHYFENGDHYRPHTDDCVITAITWFYKEPKMFTGGDLIVEMSPPTTKIIYKLQGLKEDEMIQPLMRACLLRIYDSEEIYEMSDHRDAEIDEFVLSLTIEQFEKISEYFESLPQLKHVIEYTCHVCGHENTTTLQGLQNFF